ncbi:hypothetical protein NITLEN_100077 [Nitrospira lenta]|uniref:Uncharacterized protein n=1 Tax=Nitrospira lenta TaxID=1436998 RepID=A0A330L4S8_9BACT|nr:hypothetical protein NITLEN_100077 [Nitrospira lenta]
MTRCALSFTRSVLAKYPLIRLSPPTLPTNVSTTAVIAPLPPNRSYSGLLGTEFPAQAVPAINTTLSTARLITRCIFMAHSSCIDK